MNLKDIGSLLKTDKSEVLLIGSEGKEEEVYIISRERVGINAGLLEDMIILTEVDREQILRRRVEVLKKLKHRLDILC